MYTPFPMPEYTPALEIKEHDHYFLSHNVTTRETSIVNTTQFNDEKESLTDGYYIDSGWESTVQLNTAAANIDFGTITNPGRINIDFGTVVSPS